jgi:hypothetical protein
MSRKILVKIVSQFAFKKAIPAALALRDVINGTITI